MNNLLIFLHFTSVLFGNNIPKGSISKAYAIDTRSEEETKKINDYIEKLNYDSNKVLVFKKKAPKFDKIYGYRDEFYTIREYFREKKIIEKTRYDISVIADNQHLTYPGKLILANYRLIENIPDNFFTDQNELDYVIDLPGMTNGGTFKIVPSFGDYNRKLNEVIQLWFQNYSFSHDIASDFKATSGLVWSKDQVIAEFGNEFSSLSLVSDSEFNSIYEGKKLISIYKLQQVYYRVSVSNLFTPASYFEDSVTYDEVSKKCDAKNPPLVIDTVDYGRTIYLKLVATSTNNETKTFLQQGLSFNGLNVSMNPGESNVDNLMNITIGAFVIGGGAKLHVPYFSISTLQEFQKILIEHGTFRKDNPASPITYSCSFLKDFKRAGIYNNVEYITTTFVVHEEANLQMVVDRNHYARFWVYWISLFYNDDRTTTKTLDWAWDQNNILLHDEYVEFAIRGNYRNLSVWGTVVMRDENGVTEVNLIKCIDIKPWATKRTFRIGGNTIEGECSVDPPVEGCCGKLP